MSGQSRLPIVLWMLFTLAPAAPFAQNTPAESPPAAMAPVQQLLDQGIAVSNGGDAPRALELADRALALAQQADDPAGQAQAHRLRAHQLLKLSRSIDSLALTRSSYAIVPEEHGRPRR